MIAREDIEKLITNLENGEAKPFSISSSVLRQLLDERDEAYRRGQEDMRKMAAVTVSSLAETTFDNEPEFSAVMFIESILNRLPIKEKPE